MNLSNFSQKLIIKRLPISELSQFELLKIDEFIDENNGLFFHYGRFNQIASNFYGSKLEYWKAYKHDKLVGVCPVHAVSSKHIKLLFSGLTNFEVPYGGWVCVPGLSNVDLLKDTKLRYREFLQINTSFIENNHLGCKNTVNRRETATILFQGQSLDDLWNGIGAKRRNMVRKAEKSGVEVSILASEDIIDFYSLLLDMNGRTGMVSKDIGYYQAVYREYGQKNSCLMVAYHKKNPISTLMLVGNKNAWHYWQGASNIDYNLGAGELLQWKAIEFSLHQNTNLYDMCVIERDRLPQLANYKLSFGASVSEFCVLKKTSIVSKIHAKLMRYL